MEDLKSSPQKDEINNITDFVKIRKIDETVETDMKQGSHLRRSLENRSKKTLILTGLGLTAIIILLILFGQSLLVNFSVLLGDAKNGENSVTQPIDKTDVNYIPAPILNPLSEATNSAEITVRGSISSDTDAEIRLYLNDELVDVSKIENDNTFIFDGIELIEGKNEIKALSKIDENMSDNSNIITISYLKEPPSLDVEYPKDNAEFSGENSTLQVKGKTDKDSNVKVNEFIAITKNDGSFTYNFKMQNGENKLIIQAIDKAGNTTGKEIKVTYSP